MTAPTQSEAVARLSRPEHRAVVAILWALDAGLMAQCRCWFGGGTAIVLGTGEYRLSSDIDFVCADQDGYRLLRTRIAERGAAAIFGSSIAQEREFRYDQYGIRGIVSHSGLPIRFEVIREARIALGEGTPHPLVPVMELNLVDRTAEKLLANADRCQDRSTWYRDAIDLGMLAIHHRALPISGKTKAENAYGDDISRKVAWALGQLQRPDERTHAAASLGMDTAQVAVALASLMEQSAILWPTHAASPNDPAQRDEGP